MHEAMKESLIDFFVLLLQQVHFYCTDAQKNSITMLFTSQIEQACALTHYQGCSFLVRILFNGVD
jgi:hypothetical protein